MLVHRALALSLLLIALAPRSYGTSAGDFNFDLKAIPGSYVVRNSQGRVEVHVDKPEVLDEALDVSSLDSSPNAPTLDTDDGLAVGAHQLELDMITN